MRTPFLQELENRVLVCDGAMGTMLYARGIFLNRSFAELNLTQPDLVAEVHQAYVRAGADVIETNTFGANRVKLDAFGLADRVHALNLQGAKLARHAAPEPVYVGRSVSPSNHGERRGLTKRRRMSASRPGRCWTVAAICSSSRPSATSTRSAPRSAPSAASAVCPSSRRLPPRKTATASVAWRRNRSFRISKPAAPTSSA